MLYIIYIRNDILQLLNILPHVDETH